MLRPAHPTDLLFFIGLPVKNQPSDEVLRAQIESDRLRIIELDSKPRTENRTPRKANREPKRPIGLLKFTILWETLPFIELIWLKPRARGHQLGRSAVQAWEKEMRERGFNLVLTSSAADEPGQHFWRKLGYTDCGSLTVRNKPAEIFLQKRLK
jgi:ribosomal protein S18 acetylase RimI-like enzyme